MLKFQETSKLSWSFLIEKNLIFIEKFFFKKLKKAFLSIELELFE